LLLNATTLAVLLVLVVFYIVQVNSAVTRGYRLRDLENKIQSLTLENQRLEVATRQVQSLDNVEHSVKMLGFVPAENPKYITAEEPSYALAQ